MREEAVKEIRRRCDILIENSKPGDITTGMSGSFIRFSMALCLLGTEHPDYDWMSEESYCAPVLTKEEFHSDKYDALLIELFEKALDAKGYDVDDDNEQLIS